jgi:hypothetical protein
MGAKAFVKAQCSSVGRLDRAQLRKIAAKSNGVLAGLSGKVQWLDSFVAADKDILHLSGGKRGPGF